VDSLLGTIHHHFRPGLSAEQSWYGKGPRTDRDASATDTAKADNLARIGGTAAQRGDAFPGRHHHALDVSAGNISEKLGHPEAGQHRAQTPTCGRRRGTNPERPPQPRRALWARPGPARGWNAGDKPGAVPVAEKRAELTDYHWGGRRAAMIARKDLPDQICEGPR